MQKRRNLATALATQWLATSLNAYSSIAIQRFLCHSTLCELLHNCLNFSPWLRRRDDPQPCCHCNARFTGHIDREAYRLWSEGSPGLKRRRGSICLPVIRARGVISSSLCQNPAHNISVSRIRAPVTVACTFPPVLGRIPDLCCSIGMMELAFAVSSGRCRKHWRRAWGTPWSFANARDGN